MAACWCLPLTGGSISTDGRTRVQSGRRVGMPMTPAISRLGLSMSAQSATKNRIGRTQSTRRCRMDNGKSIVQSLTLLPFALLLGACSGQSTISPSASSVRPAAIPALPPQARQLPAPSWCLPTCSSALIKERKIWQQLLINAGPGE